MLERSRWISRCCASSIPHTLTWMRWRVSEHHAGSSIWSDLCRFMSSLGCKRQARGVKRGFAGEPGGVAIADGRWLLPCYVFPVRRILFRALYAFLLFAVFLGGAWLAFQKS